MERAGNAKTYRELTMSLPGTDRSTALAVAFALDGEREEAFRYLEKAYTDGESELLLEVRSPAFDSLRTYPRFVDLLNCLGLPK